MIVLVLEVAEFHSTSLVAVSNTDESIPQEGDDERRGEVGSDIASEE